jgi:hypothetical protein
LLAVNDGVLRGCGAHVLGINGDRGKAAAALEPAIKTHPDNAELQNAAGLLALAQKKSKEAQGDFERER